MDQNATVIGLKKLDHFGDLALPAYETKASAGMDIRAALLPNNPIYLKPGERCLVPSGLIMEIPVGFEVQVRPRSGLALKYGITCLNTPGTIDADYRGEVKILLINLGHEEFTIERGMRIAQIIVAPITKARFDLTQTITQTERGEGGFGSTGLSD